MLWLFFFLQGGDAQPKPTVNAAAPVTASAPAPHGAFNSIRDALAQSLAAKVLQERRRQLASVPTVEAGNAAQQRIHEANTRRVMDHYGPQLHRFEDLTGEEALRISPKPKPSKTRRVHCPGGSGIVRLWEPLADMELVLDTPIEGEVFWQLIGKAGSGPPRPENWAVMSTAERYHWQHDENFIVVGVRLETPEPTAPFTVRVRPQSYFAYFRHEHNWCDPYHQNEVGDCRAVNHHVAAPTQLRAQEGADPMVWQVDVRIGEIGAVQEDWRRQTEDTLFGTYRAPSFRRGSARLRIAPLPEMLDVSLVCE
ncbi:MAG: hypothetical protein QNK37_35205 [Acidobacteriota bacterium]|nr:hypothetical protein [Acidobacteriota bacterium]